MSRDRRGKKGEPPATDEPLAPGPFEELFLKPSRPLDLEGIDRKSRDVFASEPPAEGASANQGRESLIYSPFTPSPESAPPFPQPTEPPPIAPDTGVFQPPPRSFEKLVGELLPPPEDERQLAPEPARRGFRTAVWAAATMAALAMVAVWLFRAPLASLLSRPPTPVETGAAPVTPAFDAEPAAGLAQEPSPTPPFPEPAGPAAAPLSVQDQPTVEPEPTPPLPPASAVVSLTWSTTATGTQVAIKGNGAFESGRVRINLLSSPPRVLVRLVRVTAGSGGEQRQVGTAEVERIRLGYHAELTPPELYVVLDLTSPAVILTDHALEGDTIRLSLRTPR